MPEWVISETHYPLLSLNAPARFIPSIIPAPSGSLSHKLSEVTGEAIQEIGNRKKQGKYKLTDYQKALVSEPQLRASVELKRLRGSAMLGKYTHSMPAIQDWVRGVLEDMDGTIEDLVSRGMIASYFGFFTAEIVYRSGNSRFRPTWTLREFVYHDPVTTSLAGNKYGVSHVIDRSNTPHVWIPIKNCIYVTADLDNSRNPYGTPSALAAMPYVKAKQALLSAWLTAGKNHASGLLIGKASSQHTVSLLGANGQPMKKADGSPMVISAVENLARQFETLDEKNFMATDLENQIQFMNLPVDSGFYQSALQYVDKKILLSQNLPSLIFDEGTGSLGNATPAIQQMIMLDAQIAEIAKKVKDQILEKVIKPLLQFNFGITAKQGYGEFASNPVLDPNTAVQKTQTLLQSMSMGVIPQTDSSAVNMVRDLLGLPKVDESQQLEEIKKAAEIQAMQQSEVMKAQTEISQDAQKEMMALQMTQQLQMMKEQSKQQEKMMVQQQKMQEEMLKMQQQLQLKVAPVQQQQQLDLLRKQQDIQLEGQIKGQQLQQQLQRQQNVQTQPPKQGKTPKPSKLRRRRDR